MKSIEIIFEEVICSAKTC